MDTTGYTNGNTPMAIDDKFEATANNILLIEDNPGDARLVELLLMESDLENCKITHKTTLQEGLDELENQGKFAAVLLDLSLPDSRGFVTLEKLLERFPDNNVIVMTGLADKEIGVNAVKVGAQDFLVKGAFDAESLAKSLRFSIERSAVLKRLEESQRIAHIGNWEYNPATHDFTGSAEVYRIFGYTSHKVTFTKEELENQDSPVYILHQLHQETLQEGSLKRDVKIKMDGKLRYVFIQMSINQNIRGKMVINGIIQDITERKQAELEMIKNRERYQNIFSHSKDAIYIATPTGKLIDCNQATLGLIGATLEEINEKGGIHEFYSPEGAREEVLTALKGQSVVKDVELEITQPSGEKRYCVISANINDEDDQHGVIYNGILRDITERKQAEELQKERDVARKSAQMKEQFIASVSHEMRTPMNAILGMSNLLLKTELMSEQLNYVSSIKQSSVILLGVINDILEVSTLQNGKVKFDYEHVDMQELLANLVNVMQYKINEKDLTFQLIVHDDVPQVIECDKLRLNQILYNLVGNAVKFTDHGFINIEVKVVEKDQNGRARLLFEVEDSGIGIPEDKLEAIFDSFTRVRSKNRLYEGTGLGLSIAKSLVRQQDGVIGARSTFGEGSTFYFELTFGIGTQADLEAVEKQEEEEIFLDEDMVFRLLLVEDHKMNQLVARKTLQKQWKNIDLTIADNGQIAVDILKENTFDIILMDIQMPVMDGYETTHYIRNNMPEAISKIPILAMTAHAHISKDEKFKEYGMDDFVLKPFEPNQLFQKVTTYVNKHRENQ